MADRKDRAPDVAVIEMAVKRQDDVITLDGKVKNVRRGAIAGLTMIFRFEDNDRRVITTQRLKIDEASLGSGEESEINAQLKDAPQAVQVRILSETGEGADLRVSNDGPFMIE